MGPPCCGGPIVTSADCQRENEIERTSERTTRRRQKAEYKIEAKQIRTEESEPMHSRVDHGNHCAAQASDTVHEQRESAAGWISLVHDSSACRSTSTTVDQNDELTAMKVDYPTTYDLELGPVNMTPTT
jgi:hypothetical protein